MQTHSAHRHSLEQQVAAQAVHAPHPTQCLTHLAPEPRDIVWSSISHPPAGALVREWLTMGAMVVLQFFWFIPITALAGLLSYSEIKKTMPWLAQMIERNEHLAAIVQNSLPSVGVITLNATLPFLLEGAWSSIFRRCDINIKRNSVDAHSGPPCEELD